MKIFWRVVLGLTLAAAGVLFLAPERMNAGQGFYCRPLDYLYCTDAESCLHETAHRLDHKLGDISGSTAFEDAVRVYIRVAWENPAARDAFTERVAFFPGVGAPRFTYRKIYPILGPSLLGWGGYSELYAEMLRWAGGSVEELPACFREFYDQELFEALLEDTRR